MHRGVFGLEREAASEHFS